MKKRLFFILLILLLPTVVLAEEKKFVLDTSKMYEYGEYSYCTKSSFMNREGKNLLIQHGENNYYTVSLAEGSYFR